MSSIAFQSISLFSDNYLFKLGMITMNFLAYKISISGVFAAALAITPLITDAEETVVRKAWLPFGLADIEQTLIFDPSEAEYNAARDDTLAKLRAGESLNNPIDGPWVRIETTATVGFEIEGIGSASGNTKYRQITAAEDALFQFETE